MWSAALRRISGSQTVPARMGAVEIVGVELALG
jgi:hypothetical protein